MKILLVDDHPELRSATRALLESAGHHVVEAPAAGEALAVFHAHVDIDLLLSDFHMPGGLDGLGLARHVRAERPELPVLFASSDAESLEAVSLPGSGAVGVLGKPFAAQALLARLAEPDLGASTEDAGPRPAARSAAPGPRARRLRTSSWVLAALLVVALGAGLLWRQSAPPPLPPPPEENTRRGAVLDAVAPSGPVASAPYALRWRAGADLTVTRWRVELRDSLDEVLLDQELDAAEAVVAAAESSPDGLALAELVLPETVRSRLEQSTAYHWRVVGFDADRVVAASETIRFRIIPRVPTEAPAEST